ncbi:peptidase M15 [Pseudoxanthomonas broegbernensis]|uniref:D-alanyl-D-alanine dipeptidase n=2 Tax=Pseudoxanthomonas broegbernensis TaxID=83619 RepID=A0A7V8K7M9_9GAMM|nr:M15 family metallopeptidase [Pseudoxanthomonas broegbernensis]KAF1687372.1 peptidase M15 [Pseudoxanthomonas broegbernensis]
MPAMAAEPMPPPAGDAAAAGMVDVRTLAPDVQVELRYAGSDNFTGAPVPGYEGGRCWLLRPAAEAVARVQAALRAQGLGLRIYDCYRPVRAVRSFMAWADGPDDPALKARWYPRVDKAALVPGYIAATSGHSRGATLDATLVRCGADGCAPLDMGTPFDFFDPLAHTGAAAIAPAQRDHRQRLRAAMAAQGLRNYPQEWWHYTLHPEPDPGTAHDFPVR